MTLRQVGLVAIALTVGIGALLLAKGCEKNAIVGSVPLVLKADEKLHGVVTGSQIETLERVAGTDEVVHKVEPNYHHGVDIIQSKDGSVKLVQKTVGFDSGFGLSTDFKRIGVGMEPFYYKNFHALVGCHFVNLHTGRLDLDLYVALAYRLPYQRLNNVSIYGGYDTDKHIIGGLYLRFGSV